MEEEEPITDAELKIELKIECLRAASRMESNEEYASISNLMTTAKDLYVEMMEWIKK